MSCEYGTCDQYSCCPPHHPRQASRYPCDAFTNDRPRPLRPPEQVDHQDRYRTTPATTRPRGPTVKTTNSPARQDAAPIWHHWDHFHTKPHPLRAEASDVELQRVSVRCR